MIAWSLVCSFYGFGGVSEEDRISNKGLVEDITQSPYNEQIYYVYTMYDSTLFFDGTSSVTLTTKDWNKAPQVIWSTINIEVWTGMYTAGGGPQSSYKY